MGITLSGTQTQHSHNLMTKTEPSYVSSPTQKAFDAAQLSMPPVKGASPSKQSESYIGGTAQSSYVESPNARNKGMQDQYLTKLKLQAEMKQLDIQNQEISRQLYTQKHQFDLQQSNAKGGGLQAPRGGAAAGPAKQSQSEWEKNEMAARKAKQDNYSRQLDADKNQPEIIQRHSTLLNQPRAFTPNPEQSTARGGSALNKSTAILHGQGSHPDLSPEQRRVAQSEFRTMVEDAKNLETPSSARKAPRVRPASPEAPLPGVSMLNSIGARDSVDYQQQKAVINRQFVQQQNEISKIKDAQQAGNPTMRSSDEYGLVSGRNSTQNSARTSYIPQYNKNKEPIPVNEPFKAEHYPSEYVLRQLQIQQLAAQEAQNQGGNNPGASVAAENNERRRNAAMQYQTALNEDKSRQSVTLNNGPQRIPLQQSLEKRANLRNEAHIVPTATITGPNVIDTVGQYEMDHKNKEMQRQMHDQYRMELDAAQRNNQPVSNPQDRIVLREQNKSKNVLTNDPFRSSNEYLGKMDNQLRGEEGSLGVNGNAPYTGRSRSDRGDHVHELMRLQELERQHEFQRQAQQANNQQPLASPRTLLYQRKHALEKDYDVGTPYGMLANSLSRNEDVDSRLAGRGEQEAQRVQDQTRYVQALEADKRRHEEAVNASPDRISLVKKTPRTMLLEEDYAVTEAAKGGGLPMFNQHDWNQLSLDQTWNVPDQDPNDSSRFHKHHNTTQMYVPPGVEQNASNVVHGGTAQGGTKYAPVAYNQQGQPNPTDTTSLPLYGLELDVEKAVRARNEANYREGMLSDRTQRLVQAQQEIEQRQQQLQQQLSYVSSTPQLHMTNAPQNINQIKHSSDPRTGGIAQITAGRQIQPTQLYAAPPPVGAMQRSPAIQNDRSSIMGKGMVSPIRQPQQAGFRSQRS